MKSTTSIALFLSLVFLISSCGRNNDNEQTEPVIRPVKTIKLGGEVGSNMRRFPARVYASKRAEMGFRVSGKVIALKVKDGDFVRKDDVLAQLDPSDFKLAVNDRQAKFDSAQANYNRGKKLVKDGFISKVDFDKLESQFKSARADLARARNDLTYTVLKAPFDGRVAKRYIENYEQVLGKQKVFSIQSRDSLDVKFAVPESLMVRLKNKRTMLSEQDKKEHPFVFARFAGDEKRYPLYFKEVATSANEQTRTFEVTFTMETPKDITLLPGMTAEVEADLSAIHEQQAGVFMVPLSVVFSDPAGADRKLVWVVGDDMILKAQEVQTGQLINDQIEIRQGLQGNERLVTAGVHYLHEGQKVRLFDGHF